MAPQLDQPRQPAVELGARNPWSWYPVAASEDLERARNMPVLLHGERLVVWRSERGGIGAWSDRCPHRGMRLSFGAVQNDSLICAYHGWTFGSDGYCRKIPAHPGNVPSRAARARIYPAIEADGYIWVCLGEPATDRPEPIETLRPIRSMHLAVDTELAIAAAFVCALDPATAEHLIFAPEVLKWTRQAATVSAEANIDTPSRTSFSVSLSLPGRLLCRLRREGLPPLHYQLLLQPSSEARCVVHLASNGSPVELNRALVRFRRYVDGADRQRHLRAIYETFVQASPSQISNDEINGAGQ
jgi:nitrite reductase/ring-hydroxylating ferredoxin subunit